EVTTTGTTYVAELQDGQVRTFELTPEDAGLERARVADLKGGEAGVNAAALRALLDGSPGAYRDIVLMTVAAALIVAGKADTMSDGVALAAAAIDSGAAARCLERLIDISNS